VIHRTDSRWPPSRPLARVAATSVALLAALGLPRPAHASFLPHDTVDKLADVLAVIVLVLVPVIGIVVFWLVHVLPEKIAHKRHHPQTEAIQVLCLLSLVFGGMLWPLAWLWAYTKPVLYKLAYGTDKLEHDAHEEEPAAKPKAKASPAPAKGKPTKTAAAEVARLRDGLDALEKRGIAADELRGLRDQVAALEASLAGGASRDGA
jgi:hypothetical protein